MDGYLFDIETPLHFKVHITLQYWEKLLTKHPELMDKLKNVEETLRSPEQIRKSRRDEFVFLFYSVETKYWLCVVVKQDHDEGFVVTAYMTDKIKEGEIVWHK